MIRSMSLCVLALSLSGFAAFGCAAPADEGQDETSTSSDAIRFCGAGNVCDPVIPPPRPDLRAEIVNNDSYCSGTLQFRVRNVGAATAPASVVSASARGSGTSSFAVPSLAPGATSAVFSRTFTFVPGDVGVSVTADATGVVTESNEANNTVFGYCIT